MKAAAGKRGSHVAKGPWRTCRNRSQLPALADHDISATSSQPAGRQCVRVTPGTAEPGQRNVHVILITTSPQKIGA
jgi:hypothetical protein